MSERFQTFSTRLRPHRIAVLTNVADKDWQSSCLAIIEYLSQIWGGYHSLIIPTDGKTIDDIFWAMLSRFDPDVILRYQKTGADLARTKPEEFEKIVAAYVGHERKEGYGQQFRRARRQPFCARVPWHLGQCRLRHELNEMA